MAATSPATSAAPGRPGPPAGPGETPWAAGLPTPSGPAPAWRQAQADADAQPLPPPMVRERSLWQPVRWSALPGWGNDALHEAWNAWLRSCERPAPDWRTACREVRLLSVADAQDQWHWLVTRLQPYRISQPDGSLPQGLLTGYYEPELSASRVRTATHTVPLYGPPARTNDRGPWFNRREIDTLPEAQAALAGREIAWLADPIDALILQIQGSGRLTVREPDGRERTVRLAFAAHNGHAYRSVGRWLLDQQAVSDVSWPAIKAWVARHPHRLQELLWSNPRTVFFREESLEPLEAQWGPRGAQGVPLTPQRSVAIDPTTVPYGTPLWMVSEGPAGTWQRLVMAQDTGGAIVGAARADYFAGTGDAALALVAGLKQPVQLWALWPRPAPANASVLPVTTGRSATTP